MKNTIRLLTLAVCSGLCLGQSAPQAGYLGRMGTQTGSPVTLSTIGSDFDTEMGLWNEQGQLVMTNDDIAPGNLQSELILSALIPGRYYVAIVGYNASFGENFFVQPGSASGTAKLQISHPSLAWTPTLTPGNNGHAGPYWYSFDIAAQSPATEMSFRVVSFEHQPIAIETDEMGIDSEIGLWDENGVLLTTQTTQNTNGNGRRLELPAGLSAGRYYVGIQTPFGAFANDFFQLTGLPTALGETEHVRINNNINELYTAGDDGYIAPLWSFEIDEACMDVCTDPDPVHELEPDYNPFFTEDSFNNGCFSSTEARFTYALMGNAYCGTISTFYDSDFGSGILAYGNDLDWYEFYLPQRTQLTVELASSFPAYLAITPEEDIDVPCPGAPSFPVTYFVRPDACGVESISLDLMPGRYIMNIFPDSYPDLSFDLMKDMPYQIRLSGSPLDYEDLGVVADAMRGFDIETTGADFDTEIGLFDATGTLIATNDDEAPGSILTSALRDLELTEGIYYLAVAGYNVFFDDGFSIDIRVGGASTLGGFVPVKVGTTLSFSSVDPDRAQWFAFEVAPPSVCPADLNDDGLLNFFDVSAFLSAYNTMNPTADFNNDGLFNFFDVSAFLTAYNAGCP
ncbi:MAG: DVUA0089 family protein [Phycisphaerales bacterium]|nr:DVUA0089 family protein [Phycisphaerales bacterium]